MSLKKQVTLGVFMILIVIVGPWLIAFSFSSEPLEIKVTNVKDTQFSVSWITNEVEVCEVRYGETESLGGVAYDDRGENVKDDIHHVTIKGLRPNTTYYYEIVSGDTVDNNGGAYYTITTGPSIIPDVNSNVVYGRIYRSDGVTPAKGTIVYLLIKDNDGVGSVGSSQLVSVLVEDGGYWSSNLKNFRTQDIQRTFEYSGSGSDILQIYAQGGGGTIARQTINIAMDVGKPDNQEIPDMILKGIVVIDHTTRKEVKADDDPKTTLLIPAYSVAEDYYVLIGLDPKTSPALVDPQDISKADYALASHMKVVPNTYTEFNVFKASDSSVVTSFAHPVTITLSYEEEDIKGIDEASLGVYHLIDEAWKEVEGGAHDMQNNTISVNIQSLSVFAIVGITQFTSYCFPNPFSPIDGDVIENPEEQGEKTDGTCIRYYLPNDRDNVSITIYDVSGCVVWERSDLPGGQGPHYVLFDAAGLASGIYIVVVKTDGEVRTFKMAIVK